MPYRRKTWEEKRKDSKNFPKILELQPNFPCYDALHRIGAEPGDSVVLAPPLEVEAIMKTVPHGQLITLHEICAQLAEKHQTSTAAPSPQASSSTSSPTLRTKCTATSPIGEPLKNDGQLNPRFPGGAERQKQLLENEGHIITQKGRKHIKYYVPHVIPKS